MGISKLINLSTSELIDIIRKKEFEVNQLKKRLKIEGTRWRNYYRQKNWRKNKQLENDMKGGNEQ